MSLCVLNVGVCFRTDQGFDTVYIEVLDCQDYTSVMPLAIAERMALRPLIRFTFGGELKADSNRNFLMFGKNSVGSRVGPFLFATQKGLPKMEEKAGESVYYERLPFAGSRSVCASFLAASARVLEGRTRLVSD